MLIAASYTTHMGGYADYLHNIQQTGIIEGGLVWLYPSVLACSVWLGLY